MPTEPPSDPSPAAPTATDPDGHVRRDGPTDTSGPEQRGAVSGDGAESGSEAETGRNGNHGETDDVAALERRVADLEAELDAVRGLLDGVGAIDETVERRASAALAKAESVEERLDSGERGLVRERLPDDGGDRPAHDRRRTPRDRDPEPAARSDRGREGDGRPGRTDPGDRGPSAAPVDGADRTRAAESGATDDAAAGSGAISSVGSGAADGRGTATAAGRAGTAEPAEDADRSLAARLRDAFR
jgi:hypothetical protein